MGIENSIEKFRDKFIQEQTKDYLLNYKISVLTPEEKFHKAYTQGIRDAAEIILSYNDIAYCLQQASLNAYNEQKEKSKR